MTKILIRVKGLRRREDIENFLDDLEEVVKGLIGKCYGEAKLERIDWV